MSAPHMFRMGHSEQQSITKQTVRMNEHSSYPIWNPFATSY